MAYIPVEETNKDVQKPNETATASGILGIGSDKLYELWLVKIFEQSVFKTAAAPGFLVRRSRC